MKHPKNPKQLKYVRNQNFNETNIMIFFQL